MGRHKKLNDMARDDWRQVVGMPDGYEVNSAGHFRSKLRMPRESKPRTVLISNGHVGFRLPGRKRTSISAARAVWQTFRGPIPPGMVVVKKNDMMDDNALENLMLSTPESYSAKVSSSKNRRTVVQIENGREVRVFPASTRQRPPAMWTRLPSGAIASGKVSGHLEKIN